MHEWGITQDLIDEVLQQARANQIKKVTRIEIAVGKLSNLTPRALRTCFQVLTKDMSLKGARLVITRPPDHKIVINKIVGES